jgi:hypothetical protein
MTLTSSEKVLLSVLQHGLTINSIPKQSLFFEVSLIYKKNALFFTLYVVFVIDKDK